METIVFRCRQCNAVLTGPLQPLPDTALLSNADGSDLLPVGFYWLSEPPPKGTLRNYIGAYGHYTVNCKEVCNTRYHSDPVRTTGCCGPSGTDGPNMLCTNGHEVGTEHSDCWMAHCVAFDPDAVNMVNE